MRLPAMLLLGLFFSSFAGALDVLSGLTPQHAVMADFNRDGRADLAVANAFDDTVKIHLQNTQGLFPETQSIRVGINPISPANFPRFLLVTDINRDGYSDLIVLCSGQFSLGAKPSVQTLLNDRTGKFGRMLAQSTTDAFTGEEFPVQFAPGEFTGDEYEDLAICNLDGKAVRILEGNGTGLFKVGQEISIDTSGEGPQDLFVYDQDRDGLEDLWIVTSNAFLVVRQISPGAFATPVAFSLSVTPDSLRAVTLAELDGDGEVDAALADADGRVHVLSGVDVQGNSFGVSTRDAPSLSGCSDITAVLWDSDTVLDLAVTNRTGNSVTILLSTGGAQSLPTGNSPRRVEGDADFDGDGRNDLIVANEGDSGDPGNPDVTLIPNPNTPNASIQLVLESDILLGNTFDFDVPAAQGLGLSEGNERYWLIDSSRTMLQETDSNGSEKITVQFPFEIGGIHFTDEHEGYVLERDSSRIRRFEIETEGSESHVEFDSSKSFVFDPGEIGFSGLAYDEEQKEFFVSAPGVGKILRLDEDGNLLTEIETEVPAWDLAWDEGAQRILAVNPGRGEIRAYSRTGIFDSGETISLAETYQLFESVGMTGVAWYEDSDRTFVLTTAGTLIEVEGGGIVDPIPTSPSENILGMDYSIDRDEIYLLNSSGFFVRLEGEDYGDPEIFSLWPAIVADPSFDPAGLAYDDASDEVLIADRNSPIAARFSRSGNFLGFRDFSAEVGSIEGPILGFDLIESPAGVCFRTANALYYGPPTEAFHPPYSNRGDLTWLDGAIYYPSLHSGELIYLASPDSPLQQRISLESPGGAEGVSRGPQGKLLVLTGGGAVSLQVHGIATQSAVERWNLYD
ncbi:MAG: VCBS repeat-containing protein [Candidatus Omnitrophica bacterium]|nr:VCBS repeat-containing protein [Candidatus Omnitrophota bacterium]